MSSLLSSSRSIGVLAVDHDVAQRVVDDGEVAQAQEVHLEQAEGLAGRVVELRDHRAVGLAAHDRHAVDERVPADDDAGGVHAPLPLEALELAGLVDDLGRARVGLVAGAELRRLLVPLVLGIEDPRQRDVLAHHARRHQLGQLVAHGVGPVEHAGGVLDGGLRLDRAVGDDLADPLLAVLLRHVADDLAAAAVVEVDVDVGHGDALGVQEPLEDQAVGQRVEVGDAHRVRGERAGGRTTAGPDPDALVLGPVDEVGDHEEVPREAHLADDPDLVVGLLAHVVGDAGRPALVQPALDLLHEPGGLVLALGQGEPGHQVGALGERDLALLRDEQGVVARLGHVGEQRAHLGGALQVVAVAVEAEAVGLVEPGARSGCTGARRGPARPPCACSAGRWCPAAGCRGPWRSPAAPAWSSSRSTGRGPSPRRRSSPCRRCPGSPRPPGGRGPPSRRAATC